MAKETKLGEFELLVLLAVLRLRDNAYGASIKKLLNDEIGRDVSIGSLYKTIERLESKSLVTTKVGEPTPERGGRAKRYLRITAKGREAVRISKDNITTMWDGLTLREIERSRG
ncbi:MAG: helix-turn-helix transcriptional regulator [Pseudohongiellaceae bacterium]